jgi:hypothetical protein
LKPLLSILIPTVYGREKCFSHLVNSLQTQIQKLFEGGKLNSLNDIEILSDIDNKEKTIGAKRELLYSIAKGVYSLQIDDDDALAKGAIGWILEAMENDADCITYKESCMMDGVYKSSNHSLKYEKWQDNFDGFDYVRTPFYKDCIKTDIAKIVPFPNIRWNEDEQWSYALKPFLRTEYHINKEVYLYQYESTPFAERYGINQ